MPATRRQLRGHRDRSLILQLPDSDIGNTPCEAEHGVGSPLLDGTERYEGNQGQREQRIDHGNEVPGDALVGERPEQQRAVTRAGIEQAMTRITEQAESVTGSESQAAPDQRIQHQGTHESAYGNECERVREVPMKL